MIVNTAHRPSHTAFASGLLALSACLSACLSGCYTVDNERFVSHVHALVSPGMKVADAAHRLEADGFTCDARSMAGALTCTKTRQRLLPSTCIERVNVAPPDPAAKAERIDIEPIVCAGF
jgi:hypothetical protein